MTVGGDPAGVDGPGGDRSEAQPAGHGRWHCLLGDVPIPDLAEAAVTPTVALARRRHPAGDESLIGEDRLRSHAESHVQPLEGEPAGNRGWCVLTHRPRSIPNLRVLVVAPAIG